MSLYCPHGTARQAVRCASHKDVHKCSAVNRYLSMYDGDEHPPPFAKYAARRTPHQRRAYLPAYPHAMPGPPICAVDVCVLGSAPAGLHAARCFQQQGSTVLMLEAATAVGGEWVAHWALDVLPGELHAALRTHRGRRQKSFA